MSDSSERGPQGRPVTAADVARRAGVSRSAVSRSFSEHGPVAAATRDKVMAAANALGYRPNLMARGLMTRRSRLVGLMLGQLNNPFFTDILRQMTAGLRRHGLQTVLATPEAGEMDDALEAMLGYPLEGLILVSEALPASWAGKRRLPPTVVLNRPDDALNGPATHIWVDDAAVGLLAAERLRADGRKHCAVIEIADPRIDAKASRFASRIEAVPGGTVERIVGRHAYQSGREIAHQLFARATPPDGIFATSDALAFGVIDALRHDLGITVPEQVSVIGLGNVPQAGWSPYDLTTVAIPVAALVDRTVAALIAAINQEGSAAPEPILLACQLVERGTTLRR